MLVYMPWIRLKDSLEARISALRAVQRQAAAGLFRANFPDVNAAFRLDARRMARVPYRPRGYPVSATVPGGDKALTRRYKHA